MGTREDDRAGAPRGLRETALKTDTADILARSLDLAGGAIIAGLDEEDAVGLAILHHLVVIWRDAQAIQTLCDAGLSDTSLLPLRRSWESVLRLQYIQVEPIARARAFIEESWVRVTRVFDEVSEVAGGSSSGSIASAISADPRMEATRRAIAAAREHVSEEAVARAEMKDRPRDASVARMAKDLHRLEEYNFLYSFLCERTHGAANASKDLLSLGETGSLRLAPQDYTEMSTRMVTAYLLYASMELLKHRQSSESQACQELLDRLEGIT